MCIRDRVVDLVIGLEEDDLVSLDAEFHLIPDPNDRLGMIPDPAQSWRHVTITSKGKRALRWDELAKTQRVTAEQRTVESWPTVMRELRRGRER